MKHVSEEDFNFFSLRFEFYSNYLLLNLPKFNYNSRFFSVIRILLLGEREVFFLRFMARLDKIKIFLRIKIAYYKLL